ncbi:aminodeoxychorismate synthase component I [Shewanella sp. KT0246]|uniref:aminodeoxychorismate synthase component I n=1 Tax=Shewanella sp. KT0246 TaxID=2815912 RepID=UPI001BC6C941|nr:aminodeoxychorismate synthase component I [Shewanella sp. KT0246]GIU53243.1 aminodeoxychorismate synthase, component I [Shewanella sp. KT0246]
MRNLGHQSLAVTSLDWDVDTHSVFSAFSQQPWAMLLDSTNSEHQDANVDIIVFNPIATVVSDSNNRAYTFHGDNADNNSHNFVPDGCSSVFKLLQKLQSHLYPVKHSSELPFSGGLIGSFNYDLGRVIENLPQQAMKDIQLADVNVGFYDFALIFNHTKQSWFAVHYLGQTALDTELVDVANLLAKNGVIKSKSSQSFKLNKIDSLNQNKQYQDNKHSQKSNFKLTSPWRNQTSKEQYSARFEKVQQYLQQGDCYQINLTQRFDADYQGCEWQAYCALSDANKAPFSAFIRLENHCILSISPERFIQLNGNQISTKPIKGTLPRDKSPEQDKLNAQRLRTSEKDLAENVMIVDLLRNDISKVATAGSVNVPKLFDIESFPAVHHLVSTVEAIMAEQYDAIDLLKAAFPGGSITGAPKIRAMEIIEELEPSRRSIYCGSIGYISQDGHMDTSITIRTLVTQNNTLYCWAGGGIVADSNVEAEYQETFDKVSKILPVLEQVNC